jgi:exonuclease III
MLSAKLLWRELGNMLMSGVSHIMKVQTVCQANGTRRFDIYVEDGYFASTMNALKKGCRMRGWFARVNILNPKDRVAKNVNTSVEVNAKRVVGNNITIASLNIRGLNDKKVEVEMLALENNIDILCLQETLRTESFWPLRMCGYNVISSHMDKSKHGARGVALAVRRHLAASVISEPSPYYIFVRILNKAIKDSMIVGCLYFPTGDASYKTQIRNEFMTKVDALHHRFPEAMILVAGDFNSTTEVVKKLLTRKHSQMALVPVIGSNKTFHRRGRPVSDIDHILQCNCVEAKAKVWMTCDLSDHYPIVCTVALENSLFTEAKRKCSRIRLNESIVANSILCHNKYSILAEAIPDVSSPCV